MKKLTFALMVLVLMSLVSYGQKKMIVPIASRASTMGVFVKPGDFVWIRADSAMYECRVNLGPSATGTYLTANTARYAVAKMATGTVALTATTGSFSTSVTLPGTSNTLTKTTANANSVTLSNSLSVGDTLVAPITTVATKLTLPGTSNTITKTTNNANSLTVSNSLSVADTLVAAVATISGTLTGTAALRDTANFGTDASGNRNKYIRKKITGVASTDRFIVVPVMASTTAVPGTAEFLGYYCTTDSLIISRNTASTAGLKVSYVRIK